MYRRQAGTDAIALAHPWSGGVSTMGGRGSTLNQSGTVPAFGDQITFAQGYAPDSHALGDVAAASATLPFSPNPNKTGNQDKFPSGS